MRSPVLGFNHNLRHMGIVFHVQTEDSGVTAPHIITHLFHGGVILGTKKMDYDSSSDEEIVRALMQAQHKSVLRELKGGQFNEKIEKYFGDKGESVEGAAKADAWQVREPGAERTASAAPVEAEGTFTEPAMDRPRRSDVIVSRPAVIVGAPPTVIGEQAAARAREAPFIDADQVENIFGQDLISEKSLDEVILAYLSEDAQED